MGSPGRAHARHAEGHPAALLYIWGQGSCLNRLTCQMQQRGAGEGGSLWSVDGTALCPVPQQELCNHILPLGQHLSVFRTNLSSLSSFVPATALGQGTDASSLQECPYSQACLSPQSGRRQPANPLTALLNVLGLAMLSGLLIWMRHPWRSDLFLQKGTPFFNTRVRHPVFTGLPNLT